MSSEEPLTFEALVVLIGYSGSLCVLFMIHFGFATRRWRRDRDMRSFRNFLIGLLLAVSTLTIFGGSLARLFPELIDAVRFFGYIIRGMLLVGGIVVVYTWLRSDADE